ncbi:GNAT family N-acetyltransferase [Solihabitans fulvus]|uniref:GNAT family N-acetyltransferase n=1 Tax=Solihabitans fulvus TaxID=1892852 RepID=A0A5B2XT99_9PSEU|nr:GNAT family N-acetyltransferase [Solihabitans fulvus]KAA2266583.1 GNAT family N-acetyltransferase [Solihabitans fulvus]
MTDHDVRVLDSSQLRDAHRLFCATLHFKPLEGEHWAQAAQTYHPGRTFGAFDGDAMIGTASSFASGLRVPGGAVVPMAAVSRVGVRADRTRRGILSALMRVQLEDVRSQGDVAASLRASESGIYGRFGYGVATRGQTVRIERRRAAPRAGVPSGGEVRLVDPEVALDGLLPTLFERIAFETPGAVVRWPEYWGSMSRRAAKEGDALVVAVHAGADGDDGYAIYQVTRTGHGLSGKCELVVHDLWAETPESRADLWRFTCDVDLVDEVVAPLRPLEEPVELLFADRRAVSVNEVVDETWLRLVDVPAALATRAYGDAPDVVIGVRDALLSDNDGNYRVGAGGASRTDSAAQLEVDVDTLAMAYLGDVRLSTLASVGRVRVADRDALASADALFCAQARPWAGTFF